MLLPNGNDGPPNGVVVVDALPPNGALFDDVLINGKPPDDEVLPKPLNAGVVEGCEFDPPMADPKSGAVVVLLVVGAGVSELPPNANKFDELPVLELGCAGVGVVPNPVNGGVADAGGLVDVDAPKANKLSFDAFVEDVDVVAAGAIAGVGVEVDGAPPNINKDELLLDDVVG